MGRKSFRISAEIKLKMICAPNSRLCKFDHIYVNVELFGETQKTDLMHPCFPLASDELFHFEKVLWSPQTKAEAFNLLRESPVSIELRHVKNKCSESILMAFADCNAYSFLIEQGKHDKDTVTTEKCIDLKQSTVHCGPSPKIKFVLVTKIIPSSTPVMDGLIQHYSDPCIHCSALKLKSENCRGGCYITPCGDTYSCDCELHKDDPGRAHHCKICHQDRILTICVTCLDTLNKKREDNEDRALTDFEDDKFDYNNEKFRPPFVVRKVPRDLVGRIPDAYDSQYNQIVRKQAKLRSDKQQPAKRLRSCSPKKETPAKHSSSGHRDPQPVCYGCLIPPDEMRISCDACNLSSRGELSNRNSQTMRPEPPLLRTYREVVDQRPVPSSGGPSCRICGHGSRPGQHKPGHSDSLFSSSRPLYSLAGYEGLAKYFCEPGRH